MLGEKNALFPLSFVLEQLMSEAFILERIIQ